MTLKLSLLALFTLSLTAQAKTSTDAPVHEARNEIACGGALSDIMQKRYDDYDNLGFDKTNPTDAAMARWLKRCRNRYKPFAALEDRLKTAGVVNPNRILVEAVRAEDPARILKLKVPNISRAELVEFKNALNDMKSTGTKPTQTASVAADSSSAR